MICFSISVIHKDWQIADWVLVRVEGKAFVGLLTWPFFFFFTLVSSRPFVNVGSNELQSRLLEMV